MSHPHHLEVDSLQEAVALAERLRRAGEYDLFRGQVRDWPIRSSFNRRDAAARRQAQERFLEFAMFVERTPELAALRGDRFGVMGVAQHYGIPTVLVDFTTSPFIAGWFAGDGDPPPEGHSGVLYMANEAHLAEVYAESLPDLRILRVDVPNLWRLEAQEGVFLHLPYEDVPALDDWLAEGFGSIRFPWTGPFDELPREAIYPDRKSRLEFLFEGFTTEQAVRERRATLEAAGYRFVSPGSRELRAEAFRSGIAPGEHPSWTETREAEWAHPRERFRRVDEPPHLEFVLEAASLEPSALRGLAAEQATRVEAFLASGRGSREGIARFHVRLEGSDATLDDRPHPDSRHPSTVARDLEDCWDGMRRFPYPDPVLAAAMGTLATAWAFVHGAGSRIDVALSALMGDDYLLVDLGLAEGGQNASAPAPRAAVSSAFRGDLAELLDPEWVAAIDEPKRILHQVVEPRRLFDLDRFVELFGRWIVPGQFLLRTKPVILFSPFRLERMGNR